jgi:hypothetical protein
MNKTIEEASAFYQLDMISSEELVDVAEAAMEDGREAEALTWLAIEADKTRSTVGPLFEQALRELGVATLPASECCVVAATFWAKQVRSGTLDPVMFGFMVGGLKKALDFPGELAHIAQEAMWHEESPTEWGYPADYASFKKDCKANIIAMAHDLTSGNLPRFRRDAEGRPTS